MEEEEGLCQPDEVDPKGESMTKPPFKFTFVKIILTDVCYISSKK